MPVDNLEDFSRSLATHIGWFVVGYSLQTALLFGSEHEPCRIAFTVLAGPAHVAVAALSLVGFDVARDAVVDLSLPSGGVVVSVLAHLLRKAIISRSKPSSS
jgi:hypothetical protein